FAASISALRHTFITVAKAGGGTSLKALLPASAVAPIRALAGVTAGIGLALDVFSLISSAHSFATCAEIYYARNETDEVAEKLRQIAKQLEEELKTALAAQAEDKDECSLIFDLFLLLCSLWMLCPFTQHIIQHLNPPPPFDLTPCSYWFQKLLPINISHLLKVFIDLKQTNTAYHMNCDLVHCCSCSEALPPLVII
ncbi:hypothetical protein PMAYCL1PPCAC_04565, partial [Pristionchus mayeri]